MASGTIYGERNHDTILNNVDISSYRSASNVYTVPRDGYVFAVVPANKFIKVSVNQSLTFTFGGLAFSDENACFVQKGMKLYILNTDITSPTIVFRAF